MKKVLLTAALVLGMAISANADISVDTIFFGDHWAGDAFWSPENNVQNVVWGGESIKEIEHMGDYLGYTHDFTSIVPVDTFYNANLTLLFWDGWCERQSEYALIYVEGAGWDMLEVDTGFEGYSINDLTVLEDGSMRVGIIGLWGDFDVLASTLCIDYKPIPEPGTMILMGLGLAGLAGFSRRRKQ